tara:strand:- start:2269 stop:2916 length:648 start_codon:yes stop_codon:yes gene_type:complete
MAAPILALTLLAGCAQQEVKDEQFSGFLGDYSGFEQLQAPDGVTVVGWISPDISDNYHSLMIDPAIVYPPERSFDRFDEADVAKALAYLSEGMKDTLGEHMTLVSEPGPGVLRMRSALTTASVGFKPMKWYNYVPVSAVAVAAGEATGLRDDGVQLIAEVELLDSVSSKRVAATARMGSSTVPQGKPVALSNIQPLLDEWIQAAGLWFDRYIAKS